jgi:hypothetical protein
MVQWTNPDKVESARQMAEGKTSMSNPDEAKQKHSKLAKADAPAPRDLPKEPPLRQKPDSTTKTSKSKPATASEHPKTSPNLFDDNPATRMASALPIWEASNILTQRKHLPWDNDSNGKLYYARDIGDGQGTIHFWVTENLEDERPATLAGAAALAVIDTFDIRVLSQTFQSDKRTLLIVLS